MNLPEVYPEINFLPAWFVQRRRRRQQRRRQVVLLLVLGVGMGCLSLQLYQQCRGLERHRDALVAQMAVVDGRSGEIAQLSHDRQELRRAVELYGRLAQPLSYSQIFSAVAGRTPETITLVEINAQTQTYERTRPKTEAEKARDAEQGDGDDSETVTEEYEVVEIEIEGVAPTNVEIANYVGQLSSSKIFRNVKMVNSQRTPINERQVRQFKIAMEVPLDRRYQVGGGQEVAHVE